MTACAGFASSYAILLLSRVGVGVGEAACAPTATSWLGDLFPQTRRSRVLALFMLGVPVGGALGFFFSGPIAQAYGWRAAMVFAAGPALLLVPALLMLQEPERGASESPSRTAGIWLDVECAAHPHDGVDHRLRRAAQFSMYAIGTFLPAFLSRVHGLSLAKSGIATGVVYLAGGVSGGNSCGLSGRFHRPASQRRPHALRRRPGFSGHSVCMRGNSSVRGLFVRGHGVPGPDIRRSHDVLRAGVLGDTGYSGPEPARCSDGDLFYGNVHVRRVLGPLLTGKLSDVLAHRAAALAGSATVTETSRASGLQQAMLIIPVLCIALAFVLYMGSRTIITDIARREAIAGGAS